MFPERLDDYLGEDNPVRAIDAFVDSKFKAVNTRDRNFTQAKMQRRLAQIDESIARYLSQLDKRYRRPPGQIDVDLDSLLGQALEELALAVRL